MQGFAANWAVALEGLLQAAMVLGMSYGNASTTCMAMPVIGPIAPTANPTVRAMKDGISKPLSILPEMTYGAVIRTQGLLAMHTVLGYRLGTCLVL